MVIADLNILYRVMYVKNNILQVKLQLCPTYYDSMHGYLYPPMLDGLEIVPRWDGST